MAQALVAVVAEILVQIALAWRRQLVYPGRIFHPVEVEVFPEGRGTEV